jgi:two-component system response regulator LytT
MEVLIIEDEAITARKLEAMLNRLDASIHVIAKLESVRESVLWLKAHKPDLIFADIHLSDGPAFEIFRQVVVTTPVVFTTAFDQYAIEAFKVNSIDYLLKPVSLAALKQAVSKYNNLRRIVFSQADLSGLVENLMKRDYQKRFMVTIGQKIRTVPVEKVAYFFAYEKLVFLVTADNNKYTLDQTLDALAGKLDPLIFFRINRKLLISHAAIGSMHHYPKSRVKVELLPPLENDMDAIVSVERTERFKQWLNK